MVEVRGDYILTSSTMRNKMIKINQRLNREVQNGELALKIGNIVESLTF